MPDQTSHNATAQVATDHTVVDMAPPGALPPLPDAQPHPPNAPQAEVVPQRKAVPQSVKILLVAIGCVAALVIAYTLTPVRALWVETITAAPIVLRLLGGDIEPVTPPATPVTTRTETTPETLAAAMVEPATAQVITPTAYPVAPMPVTPVPSSDSDSGTATTDPTFIDVGEPTPATTGTQSVTEVADTPAVTDNAQARIPHHPDTGQAVQDHARRLATLEQDTRSIRDRLAALQQSYQAVSEAVFRVQSSVETLRSGARSTVSRSAPTAAERQPVGMPAQRVAPSAPPGKPPTLIALKAIAGKRIATLRHGSTIVRLRQGQSVDGWVIQRFDLGARQVVLVRGTQEQVLTL